VFWRDLVLFWDALEAQELEQPISVLLIRQTCKRIFKGRSNWICSFPINTVMSLRWLWRTTDDHEEGAEIHHGRVIRKRYSGRWNPRPDDYMAVRCLCGNQLIWWLRLWPIIWPESYQMLTKPKSRGQRRSEVLYGLLRSWDHRYHLLQRAGRFTHPIENWPLRWIQMPPSKKICCSFLRLWKKQLEFELSFLDFFCNVKAYLIARERISLFLTSIALMVSHKSRYTFFNIFA